MTTTRNGPGEWQEEASMRNRSMLGKLRRMVIGVTSRALWQVIGHKILDGKDETHDAEVFGGANTATRPGGRNAEAIVMFGDTGSEPRIVAVRDPEMTSALIAILTGGLKLGEHAACAGTAGTVACLMHLKADGTVEIRTAAGVALPLALKSDVDALATYVDALRGYIDLHIHVGVTAGAGVSGGPSAAPPGPTPAAVGTACIKSH